MSNREARARVRSRRRGRGNETGAEDTGTEYARSISDQSSEEEDGSRDRSTMSRARSNDTVIPVDVGETTTGDGDWDSRQMMTMLTRCMQKLTTNAAVKVNLNLPKWTDEQDPEQFFTLFESVMEDHDIPEDQWLKHLKPTLQGAAQTEWTEMHREDRKRYSKVKRRLLRRLGLSSSERRRRWWDLSPTDKEPILKWHRRAGEATERYLRDFSSVRDLIEHLAMESFLRGLPPSAATWVRDHSMDDPREAGDQAVRFYDERGWDKTVKGRRRKEDDVKGVLHHNHAGTTQKAATMQQSKTEKNSSCSAGGAREKKVIDSKYFDEKKGAMCFRCKEWGHKAIECTKPVYRVQQEKPEPYSDTGWNTVQGTVGCSNCQITLDSGADVSLIREDLVPGNAYTGEVACFKGVSQISQRRPVAKVLVRVGQKKFWMKAAVVEELAGDVLLGRDCKEHLHLIREAVDLALKTPNKQVLAVSTRSQARQELEEQRKDQLSNEEVLGREFDLDDSLFQTETKAKVKKTRAVKRKDRLMAFSKADEEETGPAQLAEEQKADETLQQAWEPDQGEIITIEPGGDEAPVLDDSLNAEQRQEVSALLQEFATVFSHLPGKTELTFHEIRTAGATPIRMPPYRIPVAYQKQVREELKAMEEIGIIEPAKSSWSSPMVMVRKKDGGVRLCGDYRKLNELTEEDPYCMPRADELIDRIGRATYITTLDMTKGFYQVPMKVGDRVKTAFTTPLGRYQFIRMPFGLKGAPATFQRLVDGLLDGTQDYAAAYIDDVAVFSTSWTEHLEQLKEILTRVKDAGLTLRAEKCIVGAASCIYLGHEVGSGRISPMEAKISAIKEFNRPKTKKAVRELLGLAGYYRKFIKNFAERSVHLTGTLGGKRPDVVDWDQGLEEEFQDLKKALGSKPVLKAPDLEREFLVQTDASQKAVGAVLSQVFEKGGEKPTAFFSKKLSETQKRYTATEKEALAIVLALEHFAFYLMGRKFRLQTDHRALTKLKTMNNTNNRLMRWSMALQAYDFEVEYKPGREHLNADALSRQADVDDSPLEEGGNVRDIEPDMT